MCTTVASTLEKIALNCSILGCQCKNNPLLLYLPKFKNAPLLLPNTETFNLVFHILFGKVTLNYKHKGDLKI